MSSAQRCCACASDALHPYLSVAGQIGDEGLIPTTTRFGTSLGDIARCGACGHAQVSPMPDGELLAHAYAQATSFDYVEEEAGERETARRWLRRLERYTGTPGALLDLGCWVGFLLAEAQTRGWTTTGVEPSEFASRFARERLGQRVHTCDLLSADLSAGGFDLVTMNDVIEHLTAPGEALERIRELLQPHGLVGLVLPDAGSTVARALGRRWWSILPTHVQYFSRRSMRILLARHGFEVVDIDTAPKAFTVRYYLQRVGGYSESLARALVGAATFTGTEGRLWAPDFRDRMAVIARPAS